MREMLGDSDWVKPDGYTWHHQWVDGKKGRGQMVLVKTAVHDTAKHAGAFSVWSDILTGRAKKSQKLLLKAHKMRRTLGLIGKVAKKGCAPVTAFLTFNVAVNGWAADGFEGAAVAVGRDTFFADEVEGVVVGVATYGRDVLDVSPHKSRIRFLPYGFDMDARGLPQ